MHALTSVSGIATGKYGPNRRKALLYLFDFRITIECAVFF